MNGKPITSKPVYGYLMDEDENFIIDEEAAPVVKQIYNFCLAGNGPTKIARMLTCLLYTSITARPFWAMQKRERFTLFCIVCRKPS